MVRFPALSVVGALRFTGCLPYQGGKKRRQQNHEPRDFGLRASSRRRPRRTTFPGGVLVLTHKSKDPCLLARQVNKFEWLEKPDNMTPRPLPACLAGE